MTTAHVEMKNEHLHVQRHIDVVFDYYQAQYSIHTWLNVLSGQ